MARHARPVQAAGRHRVSNPGSVHCRQLPGVQAMLGTTRRRWRQRRPFGGRHSWAWLTHSGGQPRTAFALILSL